MSVGNIASVLSPPPTTSQTTSSSTNTVMDKDDFLKLLLSQLQHQDPLNPQDPTQFTSQLTQYSSLEQLMGVNSNLQAQTSAQAVNSQATAVSYIGKIATITGNQISVGGGVASSVHVNLASDTAKTSATITDANGKVIDTIDLGAQTAGAHDFTWDGKTSGGQTVGDGIYQVQFTAQDSKATDVAVDTSVTGMVTGVSFANGQTKLQIGGSSWSLSDVVGISAATS